MEYFMSDLQNFEVELLYENLKYADRPSCEQNRLLAFILAQANSKKKLEITEILSFAWDENYEEKNIEMSNEDRDKLRAKAAMFEKILQQNKKDSE